MSMMFMGLNTVEEKIYGNALNLVPELGAVSILKLFKFFGDFQTAWQAPPAQLRSSGLQQKPIEALMVQRPNINPEQAWTRVQKAGIDILLLGEKNYPALLTEIPSPPPILYCRGNPGALNRNALAVVGSRKMTPYGKRAVQDLISQLTGAGLNIVSGLAYGIDAESLQMALSMNSQPVAVLATPIDDASITPRANFLLGQKIIRQGCLISEYPLGAPVFKTNFPVRNRIIAGLTLGTLVVEADEDSGSLITARYALDFNREVFAVPGSIYSPVSRGANALIKQGARLVTSAQDIIAELNLDVTLDTELRHEAATAEEAAMLKLLASEPVHVDDLVRTLKSSVAQVNTMLTMLELKGRVKNTGGSTYIKVR